MLSLLGSTLVLAGSVVVSPTMAGSVAVDGAFQVAQVAPAPDRGAARVRTTAPTVKQDALRRVPGKPDPRSRSRTGGASDRSDPSIPTPPGDQSRPPGKRGGAPAPL